MKEQKLGGAIVSRLSQSSPEVLARLKEELKAKAKERRSKEYLKKAIYKVKPTELIKTIETEANELFGNLKDKSALQEDLVLFAIHFMLEKDRYVNENVLNSLETFLTRKNIDSAQLKNQDLHRIIICVALRVFAEQGSEKAERLEHLIKRMPLIR